MMFLHNTGTVYVTSWSTSISCNTRILSVFYRKQNKTGYSLGVLTERKKGRREGGVGQKRWEGNMGAHLLPLSFLATFVAITVML